MAARASLPDDQRSKHGWKRSFFFGASMVQNLCHLQKSPSNAADISFVRAHFPVVAVEVSFQRSSDAAGARASHGEIKISECSLWKRVNPLRRRSVQEAVRVQSRWLRYWTAPIFICFSFSALLMSPNNIDVTNERLFWGERLVLWWHWKN